MGLHVAGAASPGRRPFGPGWWHQPGPIGIHASAFQMLGFLFFVFERGGGVRGFSGVNLGVSYIVLAS